jgi:hypothetical protein
MGELNLQGIEGIMRLLGVGRPGRMAQQQEQAGKLQNETGQEQLNFMRSMNPQQLAQLQESVRQLQTAGQFQRPQLEQQQQAGAIANQGNTLQNALRFLQALFYPRQVQSELSTAAAGRGLTGAQAANVAQGTQQTGQQSNFLNKKGFGPTPATAEVVQGGERMAMQSDLAAQARKQQEMEAFLNAGMTNPSLVGVKYDQKTGIQPIPGMAERFRDVVGLPAEAQSAKPTGPLPEFMKNMRRAASGNSEYNANIFNLQGASGGGSGTEGPQPTPFGAPPTPVLQPQPKLKQFGEALQPSQGTNTPLTSLINGVKPVGRFIKNVGKNVAGVH